MSHFFLFQPYQTIFISVAFDFVAILYYSLFFDFPMIFRFHLFFFFYSLHSSQNISLLFWFKSTYIGPMFIVYFVRSQRELEENILFWYHCCFYIIKMVLTCAVCISSVFFSLVADSKTILHQFIRCVRRVRCSIWFCFRLTYLEWIYAHFLMQTVQHSVFLCWFSVFSFNCFARLIFIISHSCIAFFSVIPFILFIPFFILDFMFIL